MQMEQGMAQQRARCEARPKKSAQKEKSDSEESLWSSDPDLNADLSTYEGAMQEGAQAAAAEIQADAEERSAEVGQLPTMIHVDSEASEEGKEVNLARAMTE